MIRKIEPLKNQDEFNRLNDFLYINLSDKNIFRFLSYTLKPFDRTTIEELTKKHKDANLDYIVFEDANTFGGILCFKRDIDQGFELLLLLVDSQYRNKGIGQSLITACIEVAKKEDYKCVDSCVFVDNKNMLRLLIKNDFIAFNIIHNARADGMDLLNMRYYLKE
jgi:ribosomal protein S18 acetylase RimI-like enzyme